MDWLNDNSLFDELKTGNEDVFKAFFEAFYPMYVSFTYGYLDDKSESEDVVQEAFVQFWESRTIFNSIYAIRAFLYKTIRYRCLNIIRHRNVKIKHVKNSRAGLTFDSGSNAFFIDNIIREETSRMIYDEVQNLSEMGRNVITLSMEGLSNEEIADRLGMSINTVKTHKTRTYQRLRVKLDELKMLITFLIG